MSKTPRIISTPSPSKRRRCAVCDFVPSSSNSNCATSTNIQEITGENLPAAVQTGGDDADSAVNNRSINHRKDENYVADNEVLRLCVGCGFFLCGQCRLAAPTLLCNMAVVVTPKTTPATPSGSSTPIIAPIVKKADCVYCKRRYSISSIPSYRAGATKASPVTPSTPYRSSPALNDLWTCTECHQISICRHHKGHHERLYRFEQVNSLSEEDRKKWKMIQLMRS